jgi:hypothetical protein
MLSGKSQDTRHNRYLKSPYSDKAHTLITASAADKAYFNILRKEYYS